MSRALLSIAHFTLLEGRRSRLPWIALGLIGCIFVAAEFSAGLAITDSSSFRIGVYAALVRAGLVVLLVLFVATCVVRELSDRMLELTLARPVPRASWYLGRLGGFWAIALVLAAFAAVPLLAMVEYTRVLAWTAALAAELALLGAVCLTATVTLRQVVPAVLVSGAFYVLARAIDAIVLMSQSPAVVPDAWSTQVISELVALIALLLPPLDRVAATSWLLGASDLPLAGSLAAELLIFGTLVIAVGLFDLYRVDD